MYPFGNNLPNQFLSELYAASAAYENDYYQVPEDANPFWNPIKHVEHQPTVLLQVKQEAQHAPTIDQTQPIMIKTQEVKHEVHSDRSNSCPSADEESLDAGVIKLRQKYGRNINSNIFQHMIRRLHSEEKYVEQVNKIVAMHHIEMSQKEFSEFFSKKLSKLRNYVSLNKMRDLWKGSKPRYCSSKAFLQNERDFCKIFRILCRRYLHTNHVPHVYNVLRVKPESKRLHVGGARKLLELME